jgi:putative hydrolase of HD superfamily
MRDPLAGIDVPERLARQLSFCLEIDKVKHIIRRNTVADGSRREGDAEHQWHLAVMALLLAEYAAAPVDVARVVAMLLVHDLVEIDAGDAFIYDDAAREEAAAREQAAADRIFALLPEDQSSWVRGLWEEFEAKRTPEARFAGALDRLQPMLLNASADGGGWKANGVGADRVAAIARAIEAGSPTLHEVAQAMVRRAVEDGALEASNLPH